MLFLVSVTPVVALVLATARMSRLPLVMGEPYATLVATVAVEMGCTKRALTGCPAR
jgi:hypothetical protein